MSNNTASSDYKRPGKSTKVEIKMCVWNGIPPCKGVATEGSDYCSTECWKRSNVRSDGTGTAGGAV